ncbi:MAG TPA: hypothetical protein DD614_00055 [Clostridiales bacterium]|nr:hypothetical protein [Clostridiales bacterium]
MKITKLEVQKNDKNRVNLYVDDEFYSGIPAELVYLEHLKTGLEIDEKDLKKIIFENEKSKAMSRVTKYIGSSLKTQKQIRDYLRKKEYSDDTIEFVMSKLVEYNYIDDKKYAQAYVLTYGKKYGKLKLISQLKIKGVSEEIIECVLEDNKVDSIESVASKYLKNKVMSYEVSQKLFRFLYSRGYEFDEINSYINKLKSR